MMGNSKKILNIGRGMGFETKAISEIFQSEILGIDIAKDAISFAQKNYANEKILYYLNAWLWTQI
jgi:methylase of polypeptide subunit release factors